MSFTPHDFAAALPRLRPVLIQTACRKRPCSDADAEDLVSEAVRLALLVLPEYRPETGLEGLKRWLQGILFTVIVQDRRKAGHRVPTVPLETAVHLPAPVPDSPKDFLEGRIRSLPVKHRPLVRDWMAGYSQLEIAQRRRLHRNTVGNRLELAFETLGKPVPDADELTYSANLLTYCSRVTIYHKPKGVWRSWLRRHPADIHWRPRLKRWDRAPLPQPLAPDAFGLNDAGDRTVQIG